MLNKQPRKGESVKAQELNGTHLGQHVTIKVGSASITDTIRGYSATADLIHDGPFLAQLSTRPTYALGRQTLTIDFLTAGTIQVDPGTEVTIHGR